MKKFDIKDVFSWSNAENAKKYIGKSGYFADNLEDLRECVSNGNFQTLFSVDLDPKTDVDSIFSITEMDYKYALFLPEDKIKAIKPEEYRMFKDVYEFVGVTRLNLGNHVFIRKIGQKSKAKYVVSGFYYNDKDELNCVHLGANIFTLLSLFNDYEYMRMGDYGWHRFGVKE